MLGDARPGECAPGRSSWFPGGEDSVRVVKARQLPPQGRKSLDEGVGEDGGQDLAQVPGHDPGTVGGGHSAKVLGGDAPEEISHPLGRGLVMVAGPVGLPLQLLLPAHAAQGAGVGKVLGVEGDQQGGVGVGAAPPGVAHAVGDNATFFGGGRHHIAPGTHAKGIHRPVWQVAGIACNLPEAGPGGFRRTGRR